MGFTMQITMDSTKLESMLAAGENPEPILRKVGQQLAKRVRERVIERMASEGPIYTRSGALARAWGEAKERVTVRGKVVIAENDPDSAYAAIHEKGGIIAAKTAPYLHFKTRDGNWVRTKAVYIPGRKYITKARDDVRKNDAPAIAKAAYLEGLMAALGRVFNADKAA